MLNKSLSKDVLLAGGSDIMLNKNLNKGVLLAGGSGTRLLPLTRIQNKHTINIYNKQMIFYSLQILIDSGVKDILIVTNKGFAGDFLELLGDGSEFGVNLSYTVQEKPAGIADGIRLSKRFVGSDNVAVILGDNIFIGDKFDFSDFRDGAKIYLKEVDDAYKFGCPRLDSNGKLIEIVEKPEKGKEPSNYAQTGLYLYDSSVFDIINSLIPSKRDELEVSDLNNAYLRKGKLVYEIIKGEWFDAGSSFEDLFRASKFIRDIQIGRRKTNVRQ